MEIMPIISALRRNQVGAILIAIQIALTLAIVCNSLSIIQSRLSRMGKPSGIDEANVLVMQNSWVGVPNDIPQKVQADLAALRSMPDVVDAYSTNSFPLRGGGWSTGVKLQPDQKTTTARTTQYFSDDHALNALGVHLIAGRWIAADEVQPLQVGEVPVSPVVVVTKSLADALFPKGDALGKNVYLIDKGATRIIGIVERTQTPWPTASFGEGFAENSAFVPFTFAYYGGWYVVRARPGKQAAVLHAVEKQLLDVNRSRVLDEIRPFSEIRAKNYRSDRALNIILSTLCGLLLVVTAFGIVGLTTYWVAQRRRQIGVRRALGARRVDILRYFQTENLLITGAGTALGVCLAIAGNLWLVSSLDMRRMGFGYVAIGAAIVLILSQLSVIWPAIRAASIAPATATRNV
jgi:putative ABC transport system permease protein